MLHVCAVKVMAAFRHKKAAFSGESAAFFVYEVQAYREAL